MSKAAFPSLDELRVWWSKQHATPEALLAVKTRDEYSAERLETLKQAFAVEHDIDLDTVAAEAARDADFSTDESMSEDEAKQAVAAHASRAHARKELIETFENYFALAIMFALSEAYRTAREVVHSQLLEATDLHELLAHIARASE